MKKWITLLMAFTLCFNFLQAQQPYRNLIFTEVRMDDARHTFAEITNMGNVAVNLKDFELGSITPWDQPWYPPSNGQIMLPDKILQPGESFLIATFDDVPFRLAEFDPDKWVLFQLNTFEMFDKADIQLHIPSNEWGNYPQYDLITPGYSALNSWSGRNAYYLKHHYALDESVVVDAVNASFYSPTSPYKSAGPSDAAGVMGATENRILIRKFSVKEGVGDALDSWLSSGGTNPEDSEWIPLLFPQGGWGTPERKEYWTLKNHGDYTLSASSLQSASIQIDYTNGTLTVPWGVRRYWDFLDEFDYTPGLAWFYNLNGNSADNKYVSARTGDLITFYMAGNTLQEKNFYITVLPPTDDDNLVIPLNNSTSNGRWNTSLFKVTTGISLDTIYNIAYATPVDTLLKYLEKPDQASWSIIFADGISKADVRRGDILKVTALNGQIKDYYLKVSDYRPSESSALTSIRWPDIPAGLRNNNGWTEDIIPGFSSSKMDYTIYVPHTVQTVPSLIANPTHPNTTVNVYRATSLNGSLAQRTYTFECISEDGQHLSTYKVTIVKLQAPENIQPNYAEPFISDLVYRDQWSNTFIEVVNPGNQPLDLSNYMFVWANVNSPADAVTMVSDPFSWNNRYQKYIPGYRWVDQATWEVQPSMVMQDLATNPIVMPGEVFSIGDTRTTAQSAPYPWWGGNRVNINLGTNFNPWGEYTAATLSGLWFSANYYLFRINNDSIKHGLKPANDPKDFTLIDVFGSGDGSNSVIAGRNIDQIMSFTRKPHIYQGNTAFKGSFGTNAEDSEWSITDRPYWTARGYGWPADILMIADGLGNHTMDEITFYKSTITSTAYKVSPGYTLSETIEGIVTNITVAEMLGYINKADPGQTLRVLSHATSLPLDGADIVNLDDILEVVSADEENTTRYFLKVSYDGLSSDAVLTSDMYLVQVNGANGSIGGFGYGTTIRVILDNIYVPVGATLHIIDSDDVPVPVQDKNAFDEYVDTKASEGIYFEVIAEDGTTKIVYQLLPNISPNDARIYSDFYDIAQVNYYINGVPQGTAVSVLLQYIILPDGVSVQITDKTGFPRQDGLVRCGDQVIVTSADGLTIQNYNVSITGLCGPVFDPDEFPEVTYPSAPGIVWNPGTIYEITWQNFTDPYVRIELLKAGTVVRTITTSRVNTGSMNWNLASVTSGNDYKIRVTSTSNPAMSAESDNNFIIEPLASPILTYPSEPDIVWNPGTIYEITWQNFTDPYVRIELLKSGTVVRTITTSRVNTGSMNWNVASLPSGNDYKIRITSTANPAMTDESDNNFTIEPLAIPMVTYPSESGIVWNPGTIYEITWQDFTDPYVRIELLKSGTVVRTIASSRINSGSMNWNVASLPSGNDYKIRITSTANPAMTDESDNNFTIEPIAIPSVTYPSATGIVWNPGTIYEITWQDFTDPYVRIELLKGGVVVRTIATSRTNSGSMNWNVASTLSSGNDYKIRITSTANPAMTDESDNNFTIVPTANPMVSNPSATGIVWNPGNIYEITWQDFTDPYVQIELLKGGVVERTITSSRANSGSMNWNVASTLPWGNDYKIRITSTVNPAMTDESDNFFTISGPPMITYPSASGIVWAPGTIYEITWNGFTDPYVRIELLKGGSVVRTLASTRINTGSMNWNVASLPSGNDYKIKITSTANPGMTDESDNNFTIASNPVVTYPTTSGIVWNPGTIYEITWKDFTDPYVKIELLKGGTVVRTITSARTNSGSMNWRVASLPTGNDYKIKVTSTANPAMTAESGNNFTIEPAASQMVTYPTAAGIEWDLGTIYEITWQNFTDPYVRIELLKGGSIVRTITSARTNTGSMSWRVATTLTPGNDYKIRITSTATPAMTDESDNFFSISGAKSAVIDGNEPGINNLMVYPNPFNSRVTIGYQLAEKGRTLVEIFDLTGRRITTLQNALHETGTFEVVWDATDSAGQQVISGIYLCRIQSGEFVKTEKIIFNR
jgi:hypothetical protein